MKRILFVILLGFIVSSAFGQFYIQPSIGYTFSSHPMETQSTLILNNLKTVYKIKLKYGEGTHVGLNIGYNLKNNFFVELNAKQTIYSNNNVSTAKPDLQSLSKIPGSGSTSGYFGDINYVSSIFQFAPQIGYQVQRNKFGIYTKFGPNFMKSTINQTYKYIDWELDNWEFYPLNTVKKYELSGKFHMGLQANLGLSYSIKQNLQLILDFVTVYNNYEINKSEIKQYEIDGVSYLDKLENTDIKIDKDNNKFDHSHSGINIGIKYVFN